MLSMLINGRVNQPRDNLTKTSVSMLREISILSQDLVERDTLTLSTTRTLPSRLETEEDPRFGTSTKNP
jgi:hypothetical protein